MLIIGKVNKIKLEIIDKAVKNPMKAGLKMLIKMDGKEAQRPSNI